MLKNIVIVLIVFILLSAIAVTLFMHQKSFGKLPEGERLERIHQSPHYQNGEFTNLMPTKLSTSDKSRVRIFWEFLFDKIPHLIPSQPLPSVKTNLKTLSQERDFYVWFGHSSYLLQIDGKRFLIDPVLVAGSPLSFVNKMFAGSNVYSPEDIPEIDYMIITHDHWDHLDYEAVTALKNKVGKVITSLGVGSHLEYWGYPKDKIIELDWNEDIALENDLKLTALPARHFSGRGLTGNQTLWSSFMLQTPRQNIYIGGDSGYGDHYKNIAARYPEIDLAIMENGQYNEAWANIHILPDQLVTAIRELNPRKLISVHNSKFALAKHSWKEPMELIAKHAEQHHFNLFTPMIGEVFYFNEEGQHFSKWWETME
ncbi:MBL fold metallo-hydrolase [Pasteurellaceae bacterium LIM206]|nr:MBL fold metallo-hydrolase [Pasteurellaceae bacterium LIM206]